jgi:hypothetical protein
MVDYPFDMQLVVDPANPNNVVANSQITIYDPADTAGASPLALKDTSGNPILNPLVSNPNAYLEPFTATVPQVMWKSGPYSGYFNSYRGMRDEAVAAKTAAQASANSAAASAAQAQAPTDDMVDEAIVRANLPGQIGQALPALLDALVPGEVAEVIANDPTVVDSAASMAQSTVGLVPKWKASTAYTAGQMVINPSGDLVTAKVAFTSGSTYSSTNWNLTPAAALLASAMVRKNVLPDGTDINTLRTPGIYTIASSTSAATMVNLPFNVPGEIWVSKNDANTLTTQRGIGVPLSNGNYSLFTRTTRSASVWDSPWTSDRQMQGLVADGTNLAALRVPGTYVIGSATSAATMTDMPTVNGVPVNNSAVIHVATLQGTSTGEQRITIYQADGSYLKFSRITRSASSWPAWQNDTVVPAPVVPAADPLPRAGTRHAYLQQAAYARRGALGVQGKAVVSIRFDHWLNAMRSLVIPLLDKYMLCGSICLNADNMAIEQNLGTTWQQVTDMALYSGVEIWNHGGDHLDHPDDAGIVDTIVGGQQRLQTAVGPKLIVDGWMSNGSSYYDNFNFGRGFAAWTETLAAKAIQNSHAFADGKNSGYLQPLDGRIKLGASHYSAESSGSGAAIARIEEAKKHGRGITVYFHPGLIDQPGGFVLSDLEALFAYIAAERDAGRIEVLTVSGMAVADSTHSHREDLLTNTQFANSYAGWAGTSGYSLRDELDGQGNPTGRKLLSASATAGAIYQNISLYTNFGWSMGGMAELVVPAKATGGVDSTLRLQVHDTTDDTRFKKERQFTLPASGATVASRIFVTLPADQSTTGIRATIARDAGGAFDLLDEPHFRPV